MREEANEMPGEGLSKRASNGQTLLADARQLKKRRRGQKSLADEAIQQVPRAASPNEEGAGRMRDADKARRRAPALPQPMSEPGQRSRADKATRFVPALAQPQERARGHRYDADKASDMAPPRARPHAAAKGHGVRADKARGTALSRRQPNGEAGQSTGAVKAGPRLPDLASLVDQIRAWHRRRVFAMDQRKRADLALGSFLRTQYGWSRALPKAERDAINEAVADAITAEEKALKLEAKGKPAVRVAHEWSDVIRAAIKARAPFDDIEARATKEMERLAQLLPVWEAWAKDVRGFGPLSLAVIVGEAGDLSQYPKKGHLWKRMGVAVIDGRRQGGLPKSASAADWIAHGYNRKRRSLLFVIGTNFEKQGDHYRKVYLARKEYERAKAAERGLTVAPAASIPKNRAAEFISDGHIRNRARRYTEKKLLRDLWRAWRRAAGQRRLAEEATLGLPALAAE